MSQYLAAYDISSDLVRERVAQVLLSYGRRLQRSVFLVWMESDELTDFRREIGVLLGRKDRFDLLPLDGSSTRERWSWQRPPETFDPVIMG